MAHLGNPVNCSFCKKKYRPLNGGNCPFCEQAKKDKIEAAYFNDLDTLTMEERIRRIEKWIYHYKHNIPRRLAKF